MPDGKLLRERSSTLGFAFAAVVGDLYCGDDDATDCGDCVRDYQREVVDNYSLGNEKDAAEPHGEERRKGDSVGLARAHRVNRLRHIAAKHAYRGCIAENV